MRKYYGIEFLRLLTSLSILLYHYRHFFNPYTTYSVNSFEESKTYFPFYSVLKIFYNDGSYGVHMFYTISGFVFAYIYLSIKDDVSGKEFFINRLARLYPLHFATLIIVALLQIINWSTTNSFQIVHNNDLYHFFLNFFFISSWGFEEGHSFNAVIWSVSVEVFIYGIFFMLLTLLKKYKLFFSFVLCLILLSFYKFDIYDSLFLECARLFFLGVFVFFLSKNIKKKYLLFSVPIICFAIYLSFVGNFKLYLFCPTVLLLVILSEEIIRNKKIQNFFQVCGNLTYALYLLHIPMQLGILLLIKKLNISDILYLKTHFFLIYFGVLIVSAYFCFKFYEKPMNNKIRKIFLK